MRQTDEGRYRIGDYRGGMNAGEICQIGLNRVYRESEWTSSEKFCWPNSVITPSRSSEPHERNSG